MEEGQVEQQPDVMEGFLSIAKQELGEDKPRDEKGRFAGTPEAKPEAEATPETEAPAEEEQTAAPAEEEPKIEPEPRRFKLKYKGEELEKEEIEVIELAQKGFDYTQKSQALAKEREELSLKVKEQVEPKLKEYETQLENYKQVVLKLADPEALSADLNKLALEDPARAQQLFFKRIEIQNTLQTIEKEQAKIAQERAKESQDGIRKQASEAVEILKTDIPNWGDELYGKILKSGVEAYGFRPEEVNAITDHRAIKVLHDAMQYRALKSAKPSVEKRAAALAPKVVKPGTAEKPDAKEDKWKQGMAKFKKSGRLEDAVPLAMKIIEQDDAR
jgi:hypothetical protein